ncbi:hypothetical protein BC827DRAFT_1159373, partial [Russula dissimulans]
MDDNGCGTLEKKGQTMGFTVTASRTRAGTDADAPTTSSFHHRRRHHPGQATNSSYTDDSRSSSLLADDEDSLAGSLDEADAHKLEAAHVVAPPKPEKQCSSQAGDSTDVMQARIMKRSRLDSSIGSETTQATPSRDKGKGRARGLNPSTDTRTATERRAQGSGEMADVHMASKEPLNDAPSRSSVEVEQLLPSAEHDPDPRDFYASDSPVLDE